MHSLPIVRRSKPIYSYLPRLHFILFFPDF